MQPQERPAERLVGAILKFKWAALAAVAALSALAGVGAAQVGVDNSVEIWFLEGDPSLESYYSFQEVFGNDEVVAIAVHRDGGVLTPEGMEAIDAVGEAALAVEGIADVRSLATVLSVRSGAGWLEIDSLYSPPLDEGFAQQVLSDPLYAKRLVNPAGDTALVLATMESMGDIDARRDSILAALQEAVDAVEPEARYAGIGVIYAALNRLSTVDSALLIALSYGVIAVCLGLVLRRLGPVLLTLGVVGVSALWMMGLYGASGRDINMVTLILPTLMLVIGVSDCVHFLTHAARDQGAEGEPRSARVRRAIGFMFWPCLLNTLTTAAGFAALASAPMPVVRDMGVFAALGVGGAFVAALVGCSVGLLSPRFEPRLPDSALLQRLVDAMAGLAARRPGAVLVAALAVLLVGALGMTRLEVDTYSIDYLRPSHPVRVDSDAIEASFGFYTPLEFVVTSQDALHDRALLEAVAAWQDAMEADGTAGWTRSPVDTLRRMEQVLSGGGEDAYRVPPTDARLETALLMYESAPDNDLAELTDASGDRLRVTAGIPMLSARGMDAEIKALMGRAHLPEDAFITPSGYLPLYVRIMESVVKSQLSSFGLAFGLIFVLLALLFRSARLAALTVPANLVPVIFILGVMGLTGIRLDVATVTISAVVMGLVVDDTTQLLYRFRHEMQQRGDHAEAVYASVRGVGRAMASTSLVLSLGFSVLGFAAIKSISWFGILMGVAMVAALFGDLLVLPAMIVLFKPRFRSLGAR
jgi:predicted RND superfamily exporter protein